MSISKHNPYLQAYKAAQKRGNDREWFARDELVIKYAWAIPDDGAIKTIKKHTNRIVEIGAGTGYWAWMLCNAGVDVVCYDIRNNEYGHKITYLPIKLIEPANDILSESDNRNRALMLCWPPFKTKMAYDYLCQYKGDTVIYVGEGNEGCTADDSFHEKLKFEYKLVDRYKIPQYFRIHDQLYIYKRYSVDFDGKSLYNTTTLGLMNK